MIKWVAPLVVLLVIGGGLSAKVVFDNQQDDVLCEGINANRAALRNLLVSARAQTPKKDLTRKAKRFYRQQIAAIQPLDCGNFNRDSLKREQTKTDRKTDRKTRVQGGGAPPGKTKQPP